MKGLMVKIDPGVVKKREPVEKESNGSDMGGVLMTFGTTLSFQIIKII